MDAPPIRDGLLTTEGARIVAMGHDRSRNDTVDFGDAVLMPGLVNAHTHLEYSELASPIGTPQMSFPEWIAQVVAWKRAREEATGGNDLPLQAAIRQGIVELRHHGVTTAGEIAASPFHEDAYGLPEIQLVPFLEILGLAAENRREKLGEVERFVTGDCSTSMSRRGISPHAPYTVDLELLSEICRESRQRRFSVAMHLAESLDELQLLAAGEGHLVEMLRSLNAWDSSLYPRKTRPKHYLEQLACAHRALIVHGNYLEHDEIRLIAAHADRLSVVYCPRTHAYFGHSRHPLVQMLAAGINVALGTDSRASNPDLNLLAEMRLVARQFPQIAWDRVLHLGTLAGARALGVAEDCGSLTPGKRADFLVVSLPDRCGPEVLLENEACAVAHVYQAGKRVARS
jgi:cytosine/adenosine deaminase-related metal-dependent hydrolase